MLKRITDYLQDFADNQFKREFTYVKVEAVDNNTIEIYCDVVGGYETDVNCYFGGEEYIEDFINSIEHINFDANYEFDNEDMCCTILLQINYVGEML